MPMFPTLLANINKEEVARSILALGH